MRDNSSKPPSPKELMKQLHPDLFSDSRVDDIVRLPKAVFEYHLDTLTSRKQEYEFEHFCRKLAEKEVCPNLRPQTGPTGGGDSKVDTETYPVAEEIAKRWWVGSASAGSERWGFAFSAKKRWKSKIKTDVEKILSTGRDYKHIYFFTNQFVKDKDRANQEDELSERAGIPVHIFDRTWIVEKVYENDYLELAVNTLGIENVQSEKTSRPGPRDTSRMEELENLDREVADPSRYQGARYQLAEDCLRSAILARSLERPRHEVESRFAQADRLARDINYNPQLLRIFYNRAWTAFWFYEDYSAFNGFYEEVEQRVRESVRISEIKFLFNLWLLLPQAVAGKQIKPRGAKTESRRRRLVAMLEPIASNSVHKNSALQARTCLELIKVAYSLRTQRPEKLESCWLELTKIVEDSGALRPYPVQQLFDTIKVIGSRIDNPTFDILYEKLADVVSQRLNDGEAGKAYFERGKQKLQQEKSYEAIRWFGKAEELLIKDEYRKNLVGTLVGSSCAYGNVNLFWASRNKVLAAVERTLSVFKEEGQILFQLLIVLGRLVLAELRLGRIPQVLSTMTFADSVASQLNLSEKHKNMYQEERLMQEAVLVIHLLNLPPKALLHVTRLPDTLERLGLFNARAALLFALGHEQVLRDEKYIQTGGDSEAIQTYFESYLNQPAAEDFFPVPILAEGDTSFLESTILGLKFVFETPNNPVSFCIAESLLGALEAFMSTSLDGVMPNCERLTIVIKISRNREEKCMFPICFSEDGGDRAEIVHPENLKFSTADEQQDYMRWLRDSLMKIVSKTFMMKNPDSWSRKVISQERGISRALNLGDSLILTRNIFGEAPKIHLADWLESDGHDYYMRRGEHWKKTKTSDSSKSAQPLKFGDDPSSESLICGGEVKHTDYIVMSPINECLWNRAKWEGVMFLIPLQAPPTLGIIFEDSQAGQAIFRSWKEKLGDEDKDDTIRLAIVTGLSNKNPSEYAVSLGPNFSTMKKHKGKRVTLISRVRRMNQSNPISLDSFIKAYKKAGVFFLAPAQMNKEEPREIPQLAIAKKQLVIRQAWEIKENDPDIIVLRDDDKPVIPA